MSSVLQYVKWYLLVLLICIFLTTNDVEHLSCVYESHVSSLVKVLFKFLKIQVFVFLY